MKHLRSFIGREAREIARVVGDVPQFGLGGQIDARNRVWLAPDRSQQQAQQRIQQFNGSQQISLGLPVVFPSHVSLSTHPSVLGMYRPPSIQPAYAFGMPQSMTRPRLPQTLSPYAVTPQVPVQAPLVQLAQAPSPQRGFGQPHPADQLQQYPPVGYPNDSRGNPGGPVFSRTLPPDHPDNPNRVPVRPRSASEPSTTIPPYVGRPVFGPSTNPGGSSATPGLTHRETVLKYRQAAAQKEVQAHRKESERLRKELSDLDLEAERIQRHIQEARGRLDKMRKEMGEREQKGTRDIELRNKEYEEADKALAAVETSGNPAAIPAALNRVRLLVAQIRDMRAELRAYLDTMTKNLQELEKLMAPLETSSKNVQQRRRVLLSQIESANKRIETLTKSMPR